MTVTNIHFVGFFFSFFFIVQLLSVLRGHFGFFIPGATMANDFEGFLYQILSITLFSYLKS